jgi:predicted metal-dependent hydrolase
MGGVNVDGIEIEVIRKRVKHMRISVHPPDGRVRVSAPHRIDDEAIRLAVAQRLPWIRKHQERLHNAPRQPERRMLSGESHFVWGERYLLDVSRTGRPSVLIDGRTLRLTAPDGSDAGTRHHILDRWYRAQMEAVLPGLLDKWQPVIGERVESVTIRRMKTRWGSCTPSRRTIRLNLELATRTPRCLEYVLVHELVHLLERSHNASFYALMDRFLPTWRAPRDELNRSHTLQGLSPPHDID